MTKHSGHKQLDLRQNIWTLVQVISRMECHRIPRQARHLGTRWFQEKAWTPTSKLEGSHQQGLQEDRDRMGRGTGGSGRQAELVESWRPMPIRRRMNQEPVGIWTHLNNRLCLTRTKNKNIVNKARYNSLLWKGEKPIDTDTTDI